jgi:PAS domain S-box-containing protein
MNSFSDPPLLNRAPVLVLDSNHTVSYWNQNAENLFGWTKTEALGKNAHELLQTEFAQPLEQLMHQLIDSGEWKGEVVCTHKDGKKIQLSNHWILQRDDQGGILAIYEFYQDIPDYKIPKKAPNEDEKHFIPHIDNIEQLARRYRDLYENSGTGIIIIDEKGRYLLANKKAAAGFGKSPDEVIGKSMFDLLPQETAQKYLELNRELLKKGGHREYEDTFFLPIGVRSFLIFDQSIQDEQGRNFAVQSSSIDITERVRMEDALTVSEEHLRTVITNAPIVFFALDRNGVFTLLEGNGLEALGVKQGQEVGKSIFDLFQRTSQILDDFHRSEIGKPFTSIVTMRGQTFENRYSPFKDERGEFAGVIGVSTDITDRLHAEDALKVSEARYRGLFENSVVGITQTLPDGRLIAANAAFAKMYGYPNPQELLAEVSSVGQQLYANPNDREEILTILKEKGVMAPRELAVIHRDGTRFTVLVGAREVRDSNGKVYCYQAEQIDNTERKRIEVALRESEELYRQTVSSISDAVFLTDDRGNFIFICPNVDLTFGWSEAEIMSMGNITSLVGHTPFIPNEIKGELRNIEWKITDKNGNLHSLLVNIKSVNIGKATRLFTCRDITERKRTEEALRKSKASLAAAQHIAQIGSWEWNVRTDTAIWSAETFRIFGRNPDALNEHRHNFIDMLHPEDRDRVNRALEDAIKGVKKYDLEYRVLRPDKTIRIIHSRAEAVFDIKGNPYLMRGTVHDITERKQAEERVQEAYRFAQNTIDAISAHICVLDEHGVILAVNKAWRDFADDNPPSPTDYCIGMNYLDVCDKASGPNSAEAIPFATGLRAVIKGDIDKFVMEYPCHDSGKEKRWFSARITHFAEGNPLRIVITHQNITDRKLAELKVTEYTDQLHSLSQRQTELQEIERRNIARELHDEVGQVMTAVKTNLETIRLSPEPETINQQLVDSIGIVDRALDQIRTLALNLRPSLLDDFGLEPTLEWYLERQARGAQYKIKFISNLAGFRFPSVIETTCFRVVQATMTNISRHSKATRVDVKLSWNARSHKLNLSVRDNGEGFNVDAALDSARHGESLGLLGMEERVHLVGGQIEFKSTPGLGTEVRVKIRVD